MSRPALVWAAHCSLRLRNSVLSRCAEEISATSPSTCFFPRGVLWQWFPAFSRRVLLSSMYVTLGPRAYLGLDIAPTAQHAPAHDIDIDLARWDQHVHGWYFVEKPASTGGTRHLTQEGCNPFSQIHPRHVWGSHPQWRHRDHVSLGKPPAMTKKRTAEHARGLWNHIDDALAHP